MAIAVSLTGRANLIWYDSFQYTNGPLTNASAGYWYKFNGSASPSDMLVANSNLQVVATSGTYISRQDDCGRFLATTNNTTPANLAATYANTNYDVPQVLYASFTVICSTTISNNAGLPNGAGSYFASFYNGTNYGASVAYPGVPTNVIWGYGYCGRVQAFTNGTLLPKTWRMGVTDNTLGTNAADGGFPVDLAVNTPYQVVEEFDPITLQAATIWINPIDTTQTGASPTESHYTASDSCGKMLTYGVNSFAFRQPSSFGSAAFVITNVAVATTFAEAATNVWGPNAVPPVICYQPSSVTNFPGANFNLSVVANGQGLASLQYQWRKNSNNIANPNGNSNILGFGPNGGDTDTSSGTTNYFDVIVTTPHGLSVTSSVVTVGLNSTPQPPAFVSQPANTTVFQGQNASFTASVVTPGNATFTWYSNNVVMNAGVSSSGYSSTLQLNGVGTGDSGAIYKVAVTNDVFATGVVSTGAVLTVNLPSSVSIAYLHQLVDKTTWQPTNVPPSIPYQVTGTVTTYTNLTTGDTSSYYLQDGTGGINIFVTGGSTFRPNLGDVITFIGVLSSYTSGLELYADATAGSAYPYTSFTVLSNNLAGLPAPRSIGYNILTNAAYANTNLGGLFVQISDLHFGTNAGTALSTSANSQITVTNSGGQVFHLFFPYLDLDVAGQTLPAYAYTANGVVYSTGGVVTNTIVVTRWADLSTTPPPTDLAVSLTGPRFAFASSNITYSILATNAGTAAAYSVVVTDSVPVGATFVSATAGGANSAGIVTWSLGNLAANAVTNVSLTVAAPASGSVTNLASAGESNSDTNPANNISASVVTAIAPLPVAGPIAVVGGIPRVSWNVATGPTYSVLWSTNVAGPYVTNASGLTASPYVDTAHTNLSRGFYKITVP